MSGDVSLLFVMVVVVILFFIVKELLEFFKKRCELKRKFFVYKLLIFKELELNLWVYKRLFMIVIDIES